MANKITIIREEKPETAEWFDDHLESITDYSDSPRFEGLHPHVIEASYAIDPAFPTSEELNTDKSQLIITTSDNWGDYKETRIKCTDEDPVLWLDPKPQEALDRDAWNAENGITLTVTTVDADEDWVVVE